MNQIYEQFQKLNSSFEKWSESALGRLTLSSWDASGSFWGNLSHCEPAQGRLISFFKIWIQFLESFINLIQNAYVFPNTILKHLYWSEFGFLVLLWSFFHLFTFLKSKQFQSEPAHLFLEKWKFIAKWAGPGPTHSEKSKKICSWKKKFFVEKYFFLCVLWTSKLFRWKVWIL